MPFLPLPLFLHCTLGVRHPPQCVGRPRSAHAIHPTAQQGTGWESVELFLHWGRAVAEVVPLWAAQGIHSDPMGSGC